jgi:hypothetical protein
MAVSDKNEGAQVDQQIRLSQLIGQVMRNGHPVFYAYINGRKHERTFSLRGELRGSTCVHGSAAITRARALRLFRDAQAAGERAERFGGYGTTRVVTLPQQSAVELFAGYEYAVVQLVMQK